MDMLVSVIIPTHNRAGTLSRAVRSVLGQSHRQLELIVVDDGSTDETETLLAGFSDTRLQVVRQEHRGVSAARNRGLETARGAWIALLDSDDAWMEHKLTRHLRFALQGGWTISQTDEIWVRRGVTVNPRAKHAKKAGWIFEPSLELCLVSPSCVLLSRDCIQRVGMFDEALPACEDYDYWLRASVHYPVGLLPEKLVWKVGGHADQLSRKIIGLDLYRIMSLIKLLKEQGLSLEKAAAVRDALERKTRVYVQGCLKRGRMEEAQRVLALCRETASL
jgi:glycosyltransferase involved in cell wall biosynthesis